MRPLPYEDRLSILHADTLELRRLRTDLCLYYKNHHNLVDLPVSDLFVLRSCSRRGHSLSLSKPVSLTDSSKFKFCNRAISARNNLRSETVHTGSFASFKHLIGLCIDLNNQIQTIV